MSQNLDPGDYDSSTEGVAVFFSPEAGKSFYFEPSALGWNFPYRDGNGAGGSVLSGIFYYNKDFFSQRPEYPIEADFCAQAERDTDDTLYAHITFYAPGSQGDNDLLGEYFAKDDPDNVLAGFEGRDDRLTGKWNVVHDNKLEDRLREKYEGRETLAKALFYKSGAGQLPSLHLTVDELYREFLHGASPPSEPDLAGKLFYNEGFFDREDPDPINADFFVEQGEEDDNRYVLIKFYKPGTENEELLGEFLVTDPDNKSEGWNQRKTGQWKLLSGPDLAADLREKYKDEQVSDLLLYKGREDPPLQSLRFNFFRRGWEFWDKTFAVGHRLQANLFFNDPIFVDEDTEPIDATYYIERKRGGLGYYALVKFYAPGSNDLVWGESLALDPANRAGEAGLLDKVLNGEWKKVDYNIFTATASKAKESTKITLSTQGYVAEMECKQEDRIFGDEFTVKGVLTSKTRKDHGLFVRWHKDRAIFHEDGIAEDFSAYFFPEDLEGTIGSQDDLEMAVTWSREQE